MTWWLRVFDEYSLRVSDGVSSTMDFYFYISLGEKQEEIVHVDDTDSLYPLGEFDTWRLRELALIKRDREAEIACEQEREEVERRRAFPEEQRMKEDLEHAKMSREEKPKGKQVFLQKYWHKGAFHQVCPSLTYRTHLISQNDHRMTMYSSGMTTPMQLKLP